MRAFIGIDFPRELKEEICELQGRLRRYASRGRWKATDNFHLTLKFLDEITPAQKIQIDQAMQGIWKGKMPFNLKIEKLGTFDGRDSIRVLWLGLGGDIKSLQALHAEIEEALGKIGFPTEKRKFTPHVTIGQDIVFDCDFKSIHGFFGKVQFQEIEVKNLVLFKSEQVQSRRIYTKISEY